MIEIVCILVFVNYFHGLVTILTLYLQMHIKYSTIIHKCNICIFPVMLYKFKVQKS